MFIASEEDVDTLSTVSDEEMLRDDGEPTLDELDIDQFENSVESSIDTLADVFQQRTNAQLWFKSWLLTAGVSESRANELLQSPYRLFPSWFPNSVYILNNSLSAIDFAEPILVDVYYDNGKKLVCKYRLNPAMEHTPFSDNPKIPEGMQPFRSYVMFDVEKQFRMLFREKEWYDRLRASRERASQTESEFWHGKHYNLVVKPTLRPHDYCVSFQFDPFGPFKDYSIGIAGISFNDMSCFDRAKSASILPVILIPGGSPSKQPELNEYFAEFKSVWNEALTKGIKVKDPNSE
jgi:hypothetical protein